MSEEHKRKLQEGRERAKAAREAESQASEQNPGIAADDPLTRPLDPTVRPRLRSTQREEPLDLRPARLEARIAAYEAGSAMALVDLEFDLTQGARQLLMDALAAREPVVRLNPLIDWLQHLEHVGEGGVA